ncbi:hypothetical protein AVEN_205520-1, partial [Araneus ventricosus]
MQPRENEKKDKIKQKKKWHNEMKEIDYIRSQSHAIESSQQHEARNEASRYNSEIGYSMHPVVVVESMNKVCTNCKALKFKNEAPEVCCLNGLLSWDVESTKCNLLGLETVCSSLESSKESES